MTAISSTTKSCRKNSKSTTRGGVRAPYRYIRSDFFVHPKTAGLSPVARALMLLGILANGAGIVEGSPNRLAKAIASNVHAVKKGLAELVDRGLGRWFPSEETLWIFEGTDQQVTNHLIAVGVRKFVATLPQNVQSAYYSRYTQEFWERVSERVSDTVSERVSDTTDQQINRSINPPHTPQKSETPIEPVGVRPPDPPGGDLSEKKFIEHDAGDSAPQAESFLSSPSTEPRRATARAEREAWARAMWSHHERLRVSTLCKRETKPRNPTPKDIARVLRFAEHVRQRLGDTEAEARIEVRRFIEQAIANAEAEQAKGNGKLAEWRAGKSAFAVDAYDAVMSARVDARPVVVTDANEANAIFARTGKPPCGWRHSGSGRGIEPKLDMIRGTVQSMHP